MMIKDRIKFEMLKTHKYIPACSDSIERCVIEIENGLVQLQMMKVIKLLMGIQSTILAGYLTNLGQKINLKIMNG